MSSSKFFNILEVEQISPELLVQVYLRYKTSGGMKMYKKLAFGVEEQIVTIELGKVKLEGELVIPEGAEGIVLISCIESNIKYNCRFRYLTHLLRQAGLATLLIPLLTQEEDLLDQRSKHFRSNIRHLATRLVGIADYLADNPMTCNLKIGYFGASAGGGAVLLAATERPTKVHAVVAHSGYINFSSSILSDLHSPTLLIIGGEDYPIIAENEDALAQIFTCDKHMEVIPGASHKFQEPGTLEEAARLANQWFKRYLHSTESNSNKADLQAILLC
jgi:putative phosphoribosyl transferase